MSKTDLPIAEIAATSLLALLAGFFIGKSFTTTTTTTLPSSSSSSAPAKKQDQDDDSDIDSDIDTDLVDKVDAKQYDDFKMVLIVRTDLGMTKGKVAAQCGHATLACYKAARKANQGILRAWESSGQPKIALKCDSEDKMLEMQAIARSLGLIAHSICDAGRTQIAAGSRTVLGIGPGPVELINQVTGHLKLL
ncbi:peptidyl-tRNA hydrolase PTH2-domain-containing protein [Syncephalastrum racemosum]|uniref:peptidyl-tRNA hydrolase n=1 Tax=Syncephalastrum racemosum TaxID=13706 RepID=A0A1X2HB87_SYNRA|nr:peptidyl-tRNA hydrolase PTH2-domain-containing protein [Syncephalastrum racemosum]